ncbi:MAG: PilN domain-containing protein [Thermodesulfobacteriota bacterium]
MIKINLLPFRVARKRENVRRQVSVYFLTVVFLIMALIYYNTDLNSKLTTSKAREKTLQNQLKPYTEINREIALIQKNTREIQSRLEIIEHLETQRMRSIQLLEEIALAVPVNRLWLRSLTEAGDRITLQGTAMDNDTLAVFMINLDEAEHLHNVELKSSKLHHFSQYNLDASRFVLTCDTRFNAPQPAETNPKKKTSGGRN